eukprot:567493-Prorocentrum_minimum.AAC.1
MSLRTQQKAKNTRGILKGVSEGVRRGSGAGSEGGFGGGSENRSCNQIARVLQTRRLCGARAP